MSTPAGQSLEHALQLRQRSSTSRSSGDRQSFTSVPLASSCSTRARPRVLQELANGTLVKDWRSPELREVLDLCLSCKACSSDCPAGGRPGAAPRTCTAPCPRRRLRPTNHYALGWLPRWTRLVTA